MNTKFSRVLKSPFKFRLFLLSKVPMAWIAGIRMEEVNGEMATVSLKYGYLTKNPFRSIYFAVLAMAGELASGALSMLYVTKASQPVSMLVVHLDASFTKKATGRIIFRCLDGALIKEAVEKSIRTGEGQTVVAVSSGTDETGTQVAEFRITWSFKSRSSKK